MAEKTVKIKVSGQVQMVGYRWYAKQQADMLGLRGYVRNLPHGEVEVIARGEETDLKALMDYLRIGPSRSHVTGIQYEPFDGDTGIGGFQIRI